MTVRIIATRFVLALLLVVTAACTRSPDNTAASPAAGPPESWNAFTERFIEDYFRAQPFFAVGAGRHEFDGQMPDWSAAGLRAEIGRLNQARETAAAFDEASLTAEQRFERNSLYSVIDNDLFWLEQARAPFTNPAWYINRLDPEVYLSREYAPLAERMQAYIGYARAIPGIAANIRANLRTPLPRSFIDRGSAAFGGFAEFYRNDVPAVFADVENPQLQQQLAEANQAAAEAMAGLKDWLEAQRKDATGDFALGEERFAQMLARTENVVVPLVELEAAGRADLERNLQALREACARYVPNGTVRACIDKMSANKPEGGAVEGARAQLSELRELVEQKNIVSIPGTEQARVEESPPYNRGNFAYINIPGPYEKGLPSTYYVAPPDPAWTAQERAAYIPGRADLLFTSIHEVWPGHFLQFLHSNRNPSKIAALWVGYAYAEGWAHYTEELMWELGLGEADPELHVGQLTNALLRNVRYLSAIGLHTKGMTLEESEQMFRERAFADPGTARQQAARGTYDPAYLNYTLGKLMIRKLRADWVAAQGAGSGGGEALWRAFHDEFLSFGGPPIPLVREVMLGGEAGDLL